MAAILRSLTRKSVHLPQSSRRIFHAGFSSEAGVSPVIPSPKPATVDLLVKKLKNVAVKAILVENAERLVEEQKTKIISPDLLGLAMPAFIAASAIGLYMAGYSLGFEEKMKEYHSLEQGR